MFLLFAGVLIFSSCSFLFHPHINQYDAEGKKTGRWILYCSDDTTRKVSDGYFKNDLEYRRFIYYHPNGRRQARFVYGRNHVYGKSHLKAKFWYPNGKVMQKGTSLFFIGGKEVRYVYDGIWRFYDEQGKLTEKTRYEMGEPVELIYQRSPLDSSDSSLLTQ